MRTRVPHRLLRDLFSPLVTFMLSVLSCRQCGRGTWGTHTESRGSGPCLASSDVAFVVLVVAIPVAVAVAVVVLVSIYKIPRRRIDTSHVSAQSNHGLK